MSEPNLQNVAPPSTELGTEIKQALEEKVTDLGTVNIDTAAVEERLLQMAVPGQDIHKLRAAKHFNVPYEDVTKEQRAAGKALNFGELYTPAPAGEAKDLTVLQAVIDENAAPKPPTIEQQRETDWVNLVSGIIRKSKKLPENAPIDMPVSEDRYVKYAFDNKGRFSLGRPAGRNNWSMRRKLRMNPNLLELQRLASYCLNLELGKFFKKASEAASKEGANAKQPSLEQKDFQKMVAKAQARAEELFKKRRAPGKKAARLRHRIARAVNFGTVQGNSRRNPHAAA